MTEVIGEVRNAVGRDFTLMVDVQYAFPDADTCLKAIRPWDSPQTLAKRCKFTSTNLGTR